MQLAQVGQSVQVTPLSLQPGYQPVCHRNLHKRGPANYEFFRKHVEIIGTGSVTMQLRLTSLFGGLVVGLADQSAVLHQVILVTCGQLPLAHDAGETVQVIDEVLRPSHHLCGRNPLLTRRTFGPESPLEKLDSCQSIPSKTSQWCQYPAPTH